MFRSVVATRGLLGATFRQSFKPVVATQQRFLNLHEYQGKDLMKEHGIYVQQFKLVTHADQAEDAANSMVMTEKNTEWVVKAQVHAGGRGKGTFDNGFKGGVHVVDNVPDVVRVTKNMIGARLKTNQTSPEGALVNKVMIAEALDIDKETYFAILMDREHNGPVMVGSPDGGMDIEKVAEETPDRVFYEAIDIMEGMTDDAAARMAKNLGFSGKHATEAVSQMKKLYNMFLNIDATQIEINPFGTTEDGRVVCFDAKVNFDDNASFRQKKYFDQHDTAEDDPREVEAAKHNLNYIGMDGNIGCMVNGAGLAMATMDIIQLYGGKPANFLDVGGGANEQQVTEAFKLLSGDKQVKAILVNIFGGIMKCDVIAQGVVNAAKQVGLKIPLVVRLEGTNVARGKEILKESGLAILSADDLDDAAQKAVKTLA